jgi:hypothetical protein
MSKLTRIERLTYDQSCTIEDAALYLMGYSLSDVQEHWVQFSDDPSDGDWLSYEIYQNLSEDCELAENRLDVAKSDKASEDEIAAKQSEYDHCVSQLKLAHSYTTAVKHALDAEDTCLRVDSTATTNSKNPYIYLHSLKRWAHESLSISILEDLEPLISESLLATTPVKPQQKMREQEEVILNEIKKLGYDPKKLPEIQSGKSGVKAVVKGSLQKHTLFEKKSTVFDKAWERLSGGKEISFMK